MMNAVPCNCESRTVGADGLDRRIPPTFCTTSATSTMGSGNVWLNDQVPPHDSMRYATGTVVTPDGSVPAMVTRRPLTVASAYPPPWSLAPEASVGRSITSGSLNATGPDEV